MSSALPCPVDYSTVIDVGAADLDAQLVALCKRTLGEQGGAAAWSAVALADLEVKSVSGGITNMLYRIGSRMERADPPPLGPVLVRVFGKAGDVVCDREAENRIFAELSQMGFGPELHAVFGNGRVEGWYEGRRPLAPLELLQMAPVDFPTLIASKLAEMHETCCPTPTSDVEVWSQLRAWVALGKLVAFPDDPGKAEQLRRLEPFPRLEAEIDALEDLLPSPKNGHGAKLLEGIEGADRRAHELLYEQRFCHLDLLSGNIMYSEAAGDVRFIDFEYAARCYVGLDIANHFNAVPESCLILEDNFDPERYYPRREVQLHWLGAYLGARAVRGDGELLAAALRVLLDFALLAELRWVVWSVVQAGSSPVDFDYLDYGLMRFERGYLRYKSWRDAGARPP